MTIRLGYLPLQAVGTIYFWFPLSGHLWKRLVNIVPKEKNGFCISHSIHRTDHTGAVEQ